MAIVARVTPMSSGCVWRMTRLSIESRAPPKGAQSKRKVCLVSDLASRLIPTPGGHAPRSRIALDDALPPARPRRVRAPSVTVNRPMHGKAAIQMSSEASCRRRCVVTEVRCNCARWPQSARSGRTRTAAFGQASRRHSVFDTCRQWSANNAPTACRPQWIRWRNDQCHSASLASPASNSTRPSLMSL